jgi:hypothetical protein
LSQTKKNELPFFFNSFRLFWKLDTYEDWKNKTGDLNILKQGYEMETALYDHFGTEAN